MISIKYYYDRDTTLDAHLNHTSSSYFIVSKKLKFLYKYLLYY